MSAILSADDLNDFISPGVACIKPIENLPTASTTASENAYEVTTEDRIAQDNPAPAQISLSDCLACSGCVTSAEAVLVSLQSHSEVLTALDKHKSIPTSSLQSHGRNITSDLPPNDKIFVASVSPQTRASIAAAYGITQRKAGQVIDQLLQGPSGLRSGGRHNNGFTWVVDTNSGREACRLLSAEELEQASKHADYKNGPRKPLLTSACPGWICYVEKTHPHILPHLSRLKSPQALTGTMLKSTLSRTLGISPTQIWHLAIMPCFDKKLEASREELTDSQWENNASADRVVRDVDCVITTKELLLLAASRDIDMGLLPRRALNKEDTAPFPDERLRSFFFRGQKSTNSWDAELQSGTSGGYLQYILRSCQAAHPGSSISIHKGRNADVAEFNVTQNDRVILKTARYYGFRNIQNLVRKLKPAKNSRIPGARSVNNRATKPSGSEYAYIEVMACPGGCTNGGGQLKTTDEILSKVDGLMSGPVKEPPSQKEWVAMVDEAYFSEESSDAEAEDPLKSLSDDVRQKVTTDDVNIVDGISPNYIRSTLEYWVSLTGVGLNKLAYTSYREVQSDVGKPDGTMTERVVELSSKIGGGW